MSLVSLVRLVAVKMRCAFVHIQDGVYKVIYNHVEDQVATNCNRVSNFLWLHLERIVDIIVLLILKDNAP